MSRPPDTEPQITPEMTLQEIIARYPSTVSVLDRHGLLGCGGPGGPPEPLHWFARVHGVDLEHLLAELRAAAARPFVREDGAADVPRDPDRASGLYRRFIKTALLFTLTGGTALGAGALVMMALRGELGGISRGLIQVHGHFQLFGWVGLFVVGVAYQILPRLWGVPLPSPRAAALSFVLLVAGTILRTAQSLDPTGARAVLLIGAALMELAGCWIFAWTVARVLEAGHRAPAPHERYIAIGTGWLLVAACLNLAHAIDLTRRSAHEVAAHLNVPYLTLFLLGFVTFWILGVSLRVLPAFMSLRYRQRMTSALCSPLALSVAALALGEGLYLGGGSVVSRILFGAGGIGAGISLVLFAWSLGVFARPDGEPEEGVDRGYEKFIRLGYAWLAISGAMIAGLSFMVLAGRSIDHALVGAYRHALTVGFITTIMVGMASRIVPVFCGAPLFSALLREWTFWLLAAGNVIRVLFQSLSAAWGEAWLRVASLSGVLELLALLLFAVNLWRTMGAAPAADAPGRRPAIAPSTRVADLLAAYPDLLPVFIESGFAALANPILRRTVARGVSVAQACRLHGIDLQPFLARLLARAGGPGPA